jgi:two-component sensor histidine kinase
MTDNAARARISGELVTLPADLAMPFGVILHELATNAAKHGALTPPSSISPRLTVIARVTARRTSGSPVYDQRFRQHADSRAACHGPARVRPGRAH